MSEQYGAPAARTCPSCAAALTETQRFCPRCGVPVAGASHSPLAPSPTVLRPPPASPPPAPPAAPRQGAEPTLAGPYAIPTAAAGSFPDTPSAPPPQPPLPTSAGPDRPRRRGLLVAAAVAAVVLFALVTGTVVLLTGDDGSPEATDPPAGTTTTQDVVATSPAPTTAAPPTTAASPTPPAADPLGIGTDVHNQPCTGKYLVVYGTAGERDPNPARRKIPALLAEVPGSRYLHARSSCPAAFLQDTPKGEIYQVYRGAYDDLRAACDARHQGRTASWVKRLGRPATTYCICLDTASGLPPLRRGPVSDTEAFLVSDVQQFLWSQGYRSGLAVSDIGGAFSEAVETNLRDYQTDHGLPVTGALDSPTWGAILGAAGCRA